MSPKLQRLADELQKRFRQKTPGHCLRVDDLSLTECIALRTQLQTVSLNFSPHILEHDLTTDQAIEKRNLQQESLCLLIPSGTTHAAISSLGNSFEQFDTAHFLEKLERELLKTIPADLQGAVNQSLKQAKYRRKIQVEDRTDFLSAVLEQPTLEHVGTSLWRIGLIPDQSTDFTDRLKLNYDCIQALAHPLKPHTTVRQRLETTKLRKNEFLDKLERLLSAKPLEPPAKNWLSQLAETAGYDFSQWEFPSIQSSNLEEIKLKKPLRSPKGGLVAKSGNLKCEDQDSPIIAECGPKHKISVAWETTPKNLQNVAAWQVSLIPSREDYEEETEADWLRKKANQKTAQLPLDFDAEDLAGVKWVQVRVVALNDNDEEITDDHKQVIEALSERIFLELGQELPEESVEKNPRLRTSPNLPFGYLEIAQTYKDKNWQISSPLWKEGDIDYFSLKIGDSQQCRIGVSAILRCLETKALNTPDAFGRYAYTIIDFDTFEKSEVMVRNPPQITSQSNSLASKGEGVVEMPFSDFPDWLQEKLKPFRDNRDKLFKLIRDQYQGKGIVANTDWELPTLTNRAEAYVKSYIDLLEWLRTTESPSALERQPWLQFFLSIDSIELDIRYTTGHQHALLLLPTHPHRILWLTAYAALLNDWRTKLLELPKQQRKLAIDLAHLRDITPANIPFIVPADNYGQTDNWYVFARNVGFFATLLLSPACQDWSRVIADVLRFLNDKEEITPTEVKPAKISDDLEKYLQVHRYCKTRGLKVGIVNPGNARLLATAMRNLLVPPHGEKDQPEGEYPKIQRLEISTIAHSPLPMEIEGLELLRQQFYALENLADNASALYPAFVLSLTQRHERPYFANGDQHLAFHFDAANPTISLEQLSETTPESISFYGLINRWLSDSTSAQGQLKWRYWLALSKPERFERHPVVGKFTDNLLKFSKQLSHALAFLLDTQATENQLCCLTSAIGPDERGFLESLHQQSDWVLTIDRFFGADFFDSPQDPFLAELSQKYVIDYSPDFTEGLGDRLLVTTCWQEELTQIVARQLTTLNLPSTEEMVLELVTALKTLSGSYVLQLFENEGVAEAVNKTIALGITLHYLIENDFLKNAFLVPLALHPELFSEEIQQLGDFLIVQFDKDPLLITCVDATIMTGNTMPEELTSRLNKTEERLNTQYFASSEEQTIGTPLERARLIMLLRFYFAKGLRYGFLAEERVTKFNEILSKVEAGKIQPKMAKTGYLVCPTQEAERSEPVTLEGISVIKLGKGVWVAKPPSVLANPPIIEESLNELDTVASPHLLGEDIPSEESTTPTETPPQITTELPAYPSAPEIPLGKTVKGEETIFWKPSVQGSPHLLMVGIPGQGKSVTINMLLSHLQQQGVGSLTLDFHGDFCDSKTSAFQRWCHPTLWNAAQGLPFSPFEADLHDEIGQNSWKLQSWALAEVFEYVCELGTRQKDGLYQAIKKCYVEVIRRGDNSLPTISELQRQLERLEKQKEIQNSVVARCRPLLEMNVFKPDATPWDLLQTTKPGLVINLKNIGSDTVRLATSAFVLRKVYQTVLTWDKSEVMKLAIVLDEAHRLAKDQTLPTIMKEARKFGVAVIIASQNLNDFHEHVVGTVGTRIVFRSNDPESKKVSKMVPVSGKSEAKTIIENLKTGEALVKTEEMAVAKKVKMESKF